MPDAQVADLGPARAAVARLGPLARGRGWRLSTAESCTGGLVAALLTEVAGSSDYYEGGIVAYANAAKVALLGVPEALLARHGAVSAPTAIAMAEGARRRLAADAAISLTGIAGPGGGSASRPVGLVYLGLATAAGSEARRLLLPGDRAAVRAAAACAALEWLVEALAAPGPTGDASGAASARP